MPDPSYLKAFLHRFGIFRKVREKLGKAFRYLRRPDALIIYPLWKMVCASEKSVILTRALRGFFESGFVDKASKAVFRLSSWKICAIDSVQGWAEKNGIHVMVAGEVEAIPIQDPPVFGKNGYKAPSSPGWVVKSNAPYVIELSDATIVSKSSVIVVKQTALYDAAAHPLYGKFVSLEYDRAVAAQSKNHLLMQYNNVPIAKHEGGIFLSGLAADAFGHWGPEFLAKLQFFERHPDFKNLPIIVENDMPQSHFDFLRCIVDNPLVRLPANSGLLCRKLLVAPSPTFFPTELFKDHDIPRHEICAMSPRSLHYLRDRVLPKVEGKSSFGSKLYLTRRNMKWRRLINDAEISAFMQAQGFEVVEIEKVGFFDQVRMFRDAEVIVATHGSSLNNLIFANTKVKVLVPSPLSMFQSCCFYGPMKALGYEIVFVPSDKEQAFKHADYFIPVERLSAALEFSGVVSSK